MGRSINAPECSLLADPERQLALSYARTSDRDALATLWQIDERLGTIVAASREPMLGAVRLAWWREALAALDSAERPVPAEPLLAAAAERLLPRGLSGGALSAIEEGWLALLTDGEAARDDIVAHAERRGALLFTLSAALLGAVPDDVGRAGEAWALAELGHRLSQVEGRRIARAEARQRLAGIDIGRWPRALAPLGLLVILARRDAAMAIDIQRRQGSPKRLLRALAYRLIGR